MATKPTIQKKIIFSLTPDSNLYYIHLKGSVEELLPGQSYQQMIIDGKTVEGGEGFKGEIIVDLGKDGKIVGIEILGDVIPDELKR